MWYSVVDVDLEHNQEVSVLRLSRQTQDNSRSRSFSPMGVALQTSQSLPRAAYFLERIRYVQDAHFR